MRGSRPSPGTVVAVLALVAALAGTAIASPGASTSALTKKKVKKIAGKQIDERLPWGSGDIADDSLGAADIDEGSLGLVNAGDLLSALIGFDGAGNPVVEGGRGVLGVSDSQGQTAGLFEIRFNRNVVGCATVGSSLIDEAHVGTAEEFNPVGLGSDEVYVEIYGGDGTWEDHDFSVLVLC